MPAPTATKETADLWFIEEKIVPLAKKQANQVVQHNLLPKDHYSHMLETVARIGRQQPEKLEKLAKNQKQRAEKRMSNTNKREGNKIIFWELVLEAVQSRTASNPQKNPGLYDLAKERIGDPPSPNPSKSEKKEHGKKITELLHKLIPVWSRSFCIRIRYKMEAQR